MADASPVGLGAVLLQRKSENDVRVICYQQIFIRSGTEIFSDREKGSRSRTHGRTITSVSVRKNISISNGSQTIGNHFWTPFKALRSIGKIDSTDARV